MGLSLETIKAKSKIGINMGFVIGIGTAKKWKGIGVEANKHTDEIQPGFLYNLSYSRVKDFIKLIKKDENATIDFKNTSLSAQKYSGDLREFNNDSNAIWDKAYIYDKKGNLNIFISTNRTRQSETKKWEFELFDKYSLSEIQPDWEKLQEVLEKINNYYFGKKVKKIKI